MWTTLMLTSNEDIVMFRTTANDDLRDIVRPFSPTRHRKIAAKINVKVTRGNLEQNFSLASYREMDTVRNTLRGCI